MRTFLYGSSSNCGGPHYWNTRCFPLDDAISMFLFGITTKDGSEDSIFLRCLRVDIYRIFVLFSLRYVFRLQLHY